MHKYLSYGGTARIKNYATQRVRSWNRTLRLVVALAITLLIAAIIYWQAIYDDNKLSHQFGKLYPNELLNNYTPHYLITGLYNYDNSALFECANLAGQGTVYLPAKIKNNIEKNCSFVKKAQVRLVLPQKWYINIEEKVPAVIWHHEQNFILLDALGSKIKTGVSSEEKRKYIVIFGDNANQKFAALLQVLSEHFVSYKQIAMLQYLNQRRWNIFLEDGTLIKLPEQDYLFALDTWQNVSKKLKMPNQNLKTIDLRLVKQKKIFIEPR